tara:strand:- start:1821 stop:3383 length:1563 start_codon:yes stop_codon:yes gene_type:complete
MSGGDKVIRLTSRQGFADTWLNAETPKTLNLVDFTIPAGLVCNMSKSYMAFNSDVRNNAGEIVNASSVLPTAGANNYNVPNSALIRNCSISCSTAGQLESITRQDTLGCGIWGLAHTAEEARGDMNTLAAYNGSQGESIYTSFNLDSVANNVTNDGTTVVTGLNGAPLTSANIARDIKVPLKDIFGVGDIEDFDTSKWGEVSIHCETNFKLLKSHQWGGTEDVDTGFDETTAQGACETITLGVGDLLTTATLSIQYGDWQNTCPFYVGQTCLFNGTATGGLLPVIPADLELVIASIQYQNDNTANPPTGGSRVILTFEANAYPAVTVLGTIPDGLLKAKVEDATLRNTINRAELVLYLSDAQDTADAYEYITYTSEQDNGNGITSFNRGYMVEGDAENVMIACCGEGNILPNQVIKSYRYAIDNDEQTGSRDITIGSPLQFERLQRCLSGSAQIPFKNAQLKFYRQDEAQADVYDADITMICETLLTSNEHKMLNLNIESDAPGLNQIILYKQIPRQISV